MVIQLQTVGIIVKDMSKALEFYRTMGFDIPADKGEESNYDLELPNGLHLGFLTEETARQNDPNYQELGGQSLNLQFMVDTPIEVDEIYNKLINAGYESNSAPWDAFWGQRFARVIDPDGRIVNIYASI